MKYRTGFVLLVILTMISCSRKGKVPSSFIQQEEMVNLLWDMSLAEEFAESFVAKDSTKNKEIETQKEYEKVFAVHHVSRETFERSYEYYKSDPELMKTVIDSANALAQRHKQDLFRSKYIKYE